MEVADLYRQYRYQKAMPTIGPAFDDIPARWTDWVVAFDELDHSLETQRQAEVQARALGGR